MSMILDALKRSREPVPGGGSVPTLDTEHYLVRTKTKAPAWVWLLAGVTVASLGFSGFVWFRSSGDAPVTPVVAAVKSKPLAMESGASVQEPREVPSVEPLPQESTAVVSTSLQQETGDTLPVADEMSPSTAGAAAPSASVAALYTSRTTQGGEGTDGRMNGQPPVSQALSASKTPMAESADKQQGEGDDNAIDTEEVLRRAQAAIGQQRLSEYPAPLLESLSQQQKDRIPTLMYRQHDWSSTGESSVVLNGQRLQAGGQHNGFKVQAILRDSVILEWGGTTFRLRALNSWINL